MKVVDTFDYLLGTWSVERAFDDRVLGASGSFRGSAQVVVDPPARPPSRNASYFEHGELTFAGHIGPASRRLQFLGAQDGSVSARFADGGHLVDIDLASGISEGTHRCGADRYEISTIVRSRSLVEERWRVRGPDTEYDAITWLRRVGA